MTRSERPWTKARRASPMLLGVLAAMALASAALGLIAEPTRGTCNRNVSEAASMQFRVADVRELREVLPKLLLTPELEGIDGLEVVIFQGTHRAVPVYGGLRTELAEQGAFDRVVCVVTPKGEENYYSGVDLSGLDLTGITVDRQDR